MDAALLFCHMKKSYLCIDLKSFYASVECVDRGLDPFKVNLVVADPERGGGTICLAVSPAMKALGVPGRCRVFEIPKGIKYIMAPPRMNLYMQKSKQIVGIYLRYVSPDDIHVYSVDECFIDATDYLRLYHKTEKEFANMLRDAVFAETGICATAGIGTNLFLAKVALDIVAKHVPDHIGVLDEESFKAQIWHHRPITDIWNVGPGIARKLEHFGVYDLHGVTLLPKDTLWRAFGVNARFLLDHANGVEPCTIAEIKAYQPKSTSISNGQVLFRDYSFDAAELILMEMVELMTLELIRRRQRTSSIGLMVGYSKEIAPMVGRTLKLPSPTQSYKRLSDVFRTVYAGSVQQDLPIRRLNISLGGLCEEADTQLSFFDESIAEAKERSVLQTIVKLHDKYGKNSIVRGRDFEECATLRARNGMIGGHRSQ